MSNEDVVNYVTKWLIYNEGLDLSDRNLGIAFLRWKSHMLGISLPDENIEASYDMALSIKHSKNKDIKKSIIQFKVII